MAKYSKIGLGIQHTMPNQKMETRSPEDLANHFQFIPVDMNENGLYIRT